MQHFVQDPLEKIEYVLDWSHAITDGVTISTSTWTANVALTLTGPSIDGEFTVISIAGGTVKKVYQVENKIVLSNGQTFVDSIFLYIEEK
jgi:hypothetical protein